MVLIGLIFYTVFVDCKRRITKEFEMSIGDVGVFVIL